MSLLDPEHFTPPEVVGTKKTFPIKTPTGKELQAKSEAELIRCQTPGAVQLLAERTKCTRKSRSPDCQAWIRRKKQPLSPSELYKAYKEAFQNRCGSGDWDPKTSAPLVINQRFRKVLFPALHGCIESIVGLSTTDIEVHHVGCYVRPNKELDRASHVLARSIDIVGIRVGNHYYRYQDAHPFGQTGSLAQQKEWREFWEPLDACLSSRGLTGMTDYPDPETPRREGKDPRPHRTHMHLCLPFDSKTDPKPFSWMNDC